MIKSRAKYLVRLGRAVRSCQALTAAGLPLVYAADAVGNAFGVSVLDVLEAVGES